MDGTFRINKGKYLELLCTMVEIREDGKIRLQKMLRVTEDISGSMR